MVSSIVYLELMWTKLGILRIGFIHASLLPYSIRKALEHVNLDLKNQTLSFLSNKDLYGGKIVKGYKWLLFVTAILTYTYFWLLTQYYDLGEYDRLMRYIDLGFASLALLAFVPHNLNPYSLKSLGPSLQRLMHNLLSVVVFLSLPALIVTFQVVVLPEAKFLGISGLVLIAFAERSPKLFHVIRLSIKAAGAKRQRSLKKVTVSVSNSSGFSISTTGNKESTLTFIVAPSLL